IPPVAWRRRTRSEGSRPTRGTRSIVGDTRPGTDSALSVRHTPLREPWAMPYDTTSDLPDSQVDQYSHHQKEAFLKAFNNALEEYGGDESRAFAVAHAAAKRTPEKDED